MVGVPKTRNFPNPCGWNKTTNHHFFDDIVQRSLLRLIHLINKTTNKSPWIALPRMILSFVQLHSLCFVGTFCEPEFAITVGVQFSKQAATHSSLKIYFDICSQLNFKNLKHLFPLTVKLAYCWRSFGGRRDPVTVPRAPQSTASAGSSHWRWSAWRCPSAVPICS